MVEKRGTGVTVVLLSRKTWVRETGIVFMGRKGQITWKPFVIKTRGSKTRISFTKKKKKRGASEMGCCFGIVRFETLDSGSG